MASSFEELLVDPTTTDAWRQLADLAQRPFDLTAENALSPERLAAFQSSAAGLSLLYGTQRVTDEVLGALQALADQTKAVPQYGAMLRGERINRIVGHESENRQVLHTATRNVFDDLTCEHDAGQAEATEQARRQLERLERFVRQLEAGELVNHRGEPFTDLVQVGIGGSDLGPRAIYIALRNYWRPGRRVHFISNVDPDDAAAVLDGLDLSRTLVNVVSKSGKTLETLTNEQLVVQRYREAGLEPKQHFLSVTAAGSPMDNPDNYLRSFHMYDYVGGRFSATSMVGGVALAFGVGLENFRSLLRGAREMDLNALVPDIRGNLPLLAALLGIWNRNFLGYPTVAVLPYSQMLSRFVAHLQQVDMESNGKRIDRRGRPVSYDTGPIVWGEPGTNGQHAFYQLIHQSQTVIPCEFVALRSSQIGRDAVVQGSTSQQKLLANVLAQSEALATGKQDANPNKQFPGNRPNSLLVAEQLTPQTLGRLLAYYENRVALQGFIWNINSFDQEGVQLGKLLAEKYLEHFQGSQDDATAQALLAAAGL
jgi:glucose-6-phosphate isomerase